MCKRMLLLLLLLMPAATMAGMMGSGGGMGGGMMGPSGTPESPPPKDLDTAARKGYEFTRKYCSACHATPSPQKHTAAEWPAVIDRMERYMRQQGRAVPDDQVRNSILVYLEGSGSN